MNALTAHRSQAATLPLALALLLAPPAAFPAVITVEGACSLVEAIHSANTDSAVGDCPAGSGPDRLVLTHDVSLNAVQEVDSGNNGLPTVTSTVIIDGRGHVIERAPDAPASFRIATVDSTGHLTLDRVVLRGGREAAGGALWNRGTLVLERSTVADNLATSLGGGIYNAGNLYSRESLFFQNRAFELNGGDTRGGAIYHLSFLQVEDSTFEGNRAGSIAGFVERGGGGAIYAASANATISGSTFLGNIAQGTTEGSGGAILSVTSMGNLLLESSTVSGNSSSHPDSAAVEGDFELHHVTLSGNSPHALGGQSNSSVTATIIANTSGGANCVGAITDNLHNVADDNSCGTIPSGLTGLDPNLADNGGPTRTHALLEGSNAIGGAGTLCDLPSDQRGAPRVEACDIGAYEFLGCPVRILSDDTVAVAETHEECAIDAGPNLAVVGPGGDLTLRFGATTRIGDGFSVGVDARLTVEHDPSLQLLSPELIEADRERRRQRAAMRNQP